MQWTAVAKHISTKVTGPQHCEIVRKAVTKGLANRQFPDGKREPWSDLIYIDCISLLQISLVQSQRKLTIRIRKLCGFVLALSCEKAVH